jgi:multiple sugar transport system permease protein
MNPPLINQYPTTVGTRKTFGKKKLVKCLSVLALILIVFLFLFPIIWVTLTAFRVPTESFSPAPPYTLTMNNLIKVLGKGNYFHYIYNTLLVSVISTVLSLIVGSFFGYALARFKLRGLNFIFIWVFILRTIPPIATLVPLYLMVRRFGLYDTYWGLIIPYVATHIAFVTWLMRGYFEGIPKELDEAAIVDGASPLGAFLRIILPNAAPGLASSAALVFLGDWNQFLFPVILTGGNQVRVITVAIAQNMQEFGIAWDMLSASAFIAMVPAFILIATIQKYLVRGLTFGGVKG